MMDQGELQAEIQIIEIVGKGFYWGAILGKNITLSTVKLMNTLYLAKWRGKTSFHRFRAIHGGDMNFFNIATENKRELKQIYASMKKHGILAGKLPDLCGGDGKTQIVVAPCDMAKMESFLLDHFHSRLGHIKIGPISSADYERTGYDQGGKKTPEYQELEKSALKELHLKEKSIQSGQKTGYLLPEVIKKKPEQTETIKISHNDSFCGRNANWVMYKVDNGRNAVLIPTRDLSEKDKRGFVCASVQADKEYFFVDRRDGNIKRISGTEVLEKLKKEPLEMRYRKLKNLMANTQNDIRGISVERNRRNVPQMTRGK